MEFILLFVQQRPILDCRLRLGRDCGVSLVWCLESSCQKSRKNKCRFPFDFAQGRLLLTTPKLKNVWGPVRSE